MSDTRSDILSQALCLPEYPGRVRAMGFGVNHKDYFSPKKRYTQEDHDKLTSQMKDMIERMTRMENEITLLRKKDTSNNIEQPDIGVNSGQGSCTISSNSFPEVTNFSTLASIY